MSAFAAVHFLATVAISGAMRRASAIAASKPSVCALTKARSINHHRQVNQKTAEQHGVHAGRDGQREIGALGRRRARTSTVTIRVPRFSALAPSAGRAQGGTMPRSIPQAQKIRLIEVFVAPGHRVRAKRPLCPATDDDMQRREFVSTLAEPINPFISLLAT